MTILHTKTSARQQGSKTRILGEYLVNALMLGVPLYNFGIPEPRQQCIDASGSEGTPDQVIARGKQPIDGSVSAAHYTC